jgi:hypothetical protein
MKLQVNDVVDLASKSLKDNVEFVDNDFKLSNIVVDVDRSLNY